MISVLKYYKTVYLSLLHPYGHLKLNVKQNARDIPKYDFLLNFPIHVLSVTCVIMELIRKLYTCTKCIYSWGKKTQLALISITDTVGALIMHHLKNICLV